MSFARLATPNLRLFRVVHAPHEAAVSHSQLSTLDHPFGASSRVTRYAWMPALAIVAWLSYLGFEIWTHASHSVQTPWGDAITYLQKAVAFWNAVHDGHWFNPFDLEPTIRPPGTVLMSYPFGITENFHGFYFRSVFLPILCTVVAVYIAAGRVAVGRAPWWVFSIAVLYSTLPLFYWFDWNDQRWINNGFGMVDNFQAGIAALAASAMVRTLVDRSLAWQLASALLFGLTFTIKQSGLMLMGLMCLISLSLVLVEIRRVRVAHKPLCALVLYAAGSAAIIVVVFVGFVAAAWFSNYLSSDNFNWAIRALGFYKSVTAGPSVLVFHLSLGEVMPLWIATTFVVAACSPTIRRTEHWALGLAIGSVVVWILGLWYWFVPQGGGIQIRYFHPFVLMGLILTVPLAVAVWSCAPRMLRWVAMTAAVAPAVNIAALLASGDRPSDNWQYYTGVSVSVGHGRDDVDQGYRFLDRVRRGGADQEVYFFSYGAPSHFFVNVGVYEKILHPELPSFSPRDPMDWNRGFAIRTAELAGSRYVLHRNYDVDAAVDLTSPHSLQTFQAELAAFDARLSQLDERAGFKVLLHGQHLRLLEIVDETVFAHAVNAFVAEHEWRPEFHAANLPTAQRWWNAEDLAAKLPQVRTSNIRFGDAFVVHAMALTSTSEGLKVEAWWEPLQTTDNAATRYLFLHLVDDSGALLKNLQIQLHVQTPPSSDRTWHYDTVTFDTRATLSKATAIAFGIYQPAAAANGLLVADRGRLDWGGRRVLVPLP